MKKKPHYVLGLNMMLSEISKHYATAIDTESPTGINARMT